MNSLRSVLLGAIFATGLGLTASAETYYVNFAASPGGDGTSWATAMQTIQDAIVAASAGDTVTVTNGTYAPIVSGNKAITIQSVEGALATTIDGGAMLPCATLDSVTGGVATVLKGFTLQNGLAGSGAGVYGGTVKNCRIVDNCALGGGAVALDAVLENCLIADNFAIGPLSTQAIGAAGCILTNCTLVNNQGGFLSAIGGGAQSCVLKNCIVYGNSVPMLPPAYQISACVVTFSCVEGGADSLAPPCITAAPLFVDAASGDYRLQPASPCAGTGDPTTLESVDINGHSLYTNGRVNMGAFGTFAPPLRDPVAYYVSAAAGADANDGLSWETAKATIQAAIDLCLAGDTVTVTNGTYAPIVTEGKAITIQSVEGAKATIIDAECATRCAKLMASADHDAVDWGSNAIPVASFPGSTLVGFTLTNGDSFEGSGALGGTIVNCVVTNNWGDYGGGIELATAIGCLIVGNAGEYGGGAENSILFNCTVADNEAYEMAGGLSLCAVTNSVVWGNISHSEANGKNDINLCDVAYSCVNTNSYRTTLTDLKGSGRTPVGNILVDPVFADAAAGNYLLTPYSPCRGAGDPASAEPLLDMNGKTLFTGGVINMGAFSVAPATWYVNAASADDSGNGLTWAAAKKTIQAAIDLAEEGDTVTVTNGTYFLIATANKAITVESVEGAGKTFIQGAVGGRAASLMSDDQYADLEANGTSYQATALIGFTLRYGSPNGSGVAGLAGGALGGTLINCRLVNNTAADVSGALESSLTNCAVFQNSATAGACAVKNSLLTNCTVLGNLGADAAAVDGCTLLNAIVWGNSGITQVSGGTAAYSCIEGGAAGEGNIASEPAFINAVTGDCRLLPGSPCIDAGTTNGLTVTGIDLYGNPRLAGDSIDMGAAEGAFVQISSTGAIDPAGAFILPYGTEKTFTATNLVNAAGRPFTGFVTNGVFAVTNATFAWAGLDVSPITLEASYLVRGVYTVTNEEGVVTSVTNNLVTGVSLYDQLGTPEPVKGFRFLGWSASPAGDLIEETALAGATDTRYYAQWREYTKPFDDPAEAPAWSAAGIYNGFIHTYVEATGETDEYWKVGATLTVTVSTGGSISAVLGTPAGRITFPVAKTWSLVDDDGTPWAAFASRTGWALEIAVRSGRIWGTALSPDGEEFEIDGSRNRFKDKSDFVAMDALNRLKGTYTAAFVDDDAPLGRRRSYASGYLTLTVSAAGSMRYSGALPDGTTFSGADTLQLYTEEGLLAGAPILKVFSAKVASGIANRAMSVKGSVGGLLWFSPEPESDAGAIRVTTYHDWPFHWEKNGTPLTAFAAIGYTYRREATVVEEHRFGAYLDSIPWFEARATESLTDLRFDSIEAGTLLAPNARGTALVAPRSTSPVKLPDGSYDFSAENSARLTWGVTLANGLFSGAFRGYAEVPGPRNTTLLRTVMVNYRGVVIQLPDGGAWVGAGQALIPQTDPAVKAFQPRIVRPVVVEPDFT